MTAPEVERLTTSDAARRLGVSTTTVRRRIASGHLNAERHRRPQGVRYVVLWEPTGVGPDIEADLLNTPDSDAEVLAAPERVAWFWWLLFPAVTALGMTVGRWLS